SVVSLISASRLLKINSLNHNLSEKDGHYSGKFTHNTIGDKKYFWPQTQTLNFYYGPLYNAVRLKLTSCNLHSTS
ncbi:MAG: hypothetical protein WDW20_05320, partial [Neisseriaceae bacterium]